MAGAADIMQARRGQGGIPCACIFRGRKRLCLAEPVAVALTPNSVRRQGLEEREEELAAVGCQLEEAIGLVAAAEARYRGALEEAARHRQATAAALAEQQALRAELASIRATLAAAQQAQQGYEAAVQEAQQARQEAAQWRARHLTQEDQCAMLQSKLKALSQQNGQLRSTMELVDRLQVRGGGGLPPASPRTRLSERGMQ